MAKLILSMDGLLLKEIRLSDERTTIGRRPGNTVVIDNQAVSRDHAVVISILNDAFLEDLDSTNGTVVNGQPVRKHHLQDNNVVELGKYRLKYLTERSVGPGPSTFAGVAMRADARRRLLTAEAPKGQATLQILDGPNAGREIPINRTLTTLGRAGEQVATLSQRNDGHFLAHVEGSSYPVVNGKMLGAEAIPLNNHDVLEVAGIRMEFFFK